MKRPNARKIRIAVVEDEADYRAVLDRWLKPLYKTVLFESAEGLLEGNPRDSEADLIITDVKMPGMNGFRLCESLQRHPRFSRIPVLFLTGVTSDEGFLSGQDAGASAYLTKPIERQNLLEQIEKLLDKQSA